MVMLSGTPGAEAERSTRDAATGFMYLFLGPHTELKAMLT